MNNRCNNEKNSSYDLYGARGIKVCEEWVVYENFSAWSMENGYTKSLTLDRKDVNKDYSPENCRWATVREQQLNKRNTLRYTLDGKTMTLIEWSELLGVDYGTLTRRIYSGWTIEDVLTRPLRKRVK